MYPISLVFDSLRNPARTLSATFEEAPERDLEPVRSLEAISSTRAGIARFIKATVGSLGIGLLSAVILWRLYSNGTMVSAIRDSHSLTCQRMTVSLVNEGKLVPGDEAADQRANIPRTPALMEKSQLCRDKCAADAP
jgi:hypothetical protein